MLKTHINNILGLKAAIKVYPVLWFHGDGNIYHKEHESDTRRFFGNPVPGGGEAPHTYRAKFTQGDHIPETVEEMNKVLFASKNQESIDASKPKELNAVATFSITPEIETAKVVDTAAADQLAKDKADFEASKTNALEEFAKERAEFQAQQEELAAQKKSFEDAKAADELAKEKLNTTTADTDIQA